MVKRRGAVSIAGFAHPARELAFRFAPLMLILLSFMLMVLGRANPVLVSSWRVTLIDGLSPVLSILASPGQAVLDVSDSVAGYFSLQAENVRLRAENRNLKAWYHRAEDVDAENHRLRELLHFSPPPEARFVTARVFAVPGSGFMDSVLISAGEKQGVVAGQAVLSGDGLVGRVLESGTKTSRVLLLSDMSSRMPVLLEDSRQRAILAGGHSGELVLLHLRPDLRMNVGERVVSSDSGGMFPSGLPVGVVSSVDPQARSATVTPYADLGRIDVVQVVDFSALMPPDAEASEGERKP
ncbi:MAG TPA: rod shape-determining protein MreC [Rhodospirillaceae bacterium]|nr:MAG: rod shape-determining protein MreC [Alphaproteobacteria bacterium GWF2_58_20]HAU29151.1 rod shape-determining protein MreC [Rhodospirillaceae bacterium]